MEEDDIKFVKKVTNAFFLSILKNKKLEISERRLAGELAINEILEIIKNEDSDGR